MKDRGISRFVCALPLLLALSSHAADSTFPETIGGGLFCLDRISQAYFMSWISERYGPPAKRKGQAYWFDLTGEKLFGATLKYLFVGDGTSDYDFIGAVFEESPEDVVKRIDEYTGRKVDLVPDADGYEAKSGTKIIRDYDGSAKMYCAIKIK